MLTVLVVWCFAFYGTLSVTLDEWLGVGPYSHGLIGPLAAGYFFWQSRDRMAPADGGLCWPGVLLALLCGVGWGLATLINVVLLQQLAVVGLLFSVFLALLGWRNRHCLFFPFLLVLLVLPVWNLLQLPLQQLATVVTRGLMGLTDVPVLVNGHEFTVPGGRFVIEEACSGLGFLLIGLFIGLCFIRVNHLTGWRIPGFLLFAVGLALVANWIRILVIILVGDATQMQHPIVTDHLGFGWIVYVITLVPLILGGRWLFMPAAPVARKAASLSPSRGRPSGLSMANWMSAVVLVMVFPLLMLMANSRVDPRYALQLPAEIMGATPQASSRALSNWHPRYLGAGSERLAMYQLGAQQLYVYVANYPRQSQGQELIYVDNRLYDKANWRLLLPGGSAGARAPAHLEMLRLQGHRAHRRLIGYWYVIDGQYTHDPLQAKLYDLYAALKGGAGASVIAVALDYPAGSEAQAVTQLADFSATLQRQLL